MTTITTAGVSSLAILTDPLVRDFIANDPVAKQQLAAIRMLQHRVGSYTDQRTSVVRSVERSQQALIDAIGREIPRSPADSAALTAWRSALISAMSAGNPLPRVPGSISSAAGMQNFVNSIASDRAELADLDTNLSTCWGRQREILTKLVSRCGMPLDVANTVQLPQPQAPVAKESTPATALTSGMQAPKPGTPSPNPAPTVRPATPAAIAGHGRFSAADVASVDISRRCHLTSSETKRLRELCADPATAVRLHAASERDVLIAVGSPVPDVNA